MWELAVGLEPLRGAPVRFERTEDALRFLRHLAAEEGTAALREIVAAEWPGAGVHRMDDAEVLERLAAEVAAGVVRVAMAPLPAPSRFPVGGGSASPAAAGRPPTPREMEAAARAARPLPAEPRRSAPAARSQSPDAVAPAPAPEEEAAPPPLDWVEIQLVGEDDAPIPGERYVVELPDGSRREGTLDGEGVARIEEIPAGTCRVSFPELDRDAWVPV